MAQRTRGRESQALGAEQDRARLDTQSPPLPGRHRLSDQGHPEGDLSKEPFRARVC